MPNINQSRDWTPYELTQLARSNLSNLSQIVTDDTPVEYLTQRVDFCGHRFKVTPDVLIPRIETEQLVTMANQFVTKLTKKPIRILEVGTGSGAIGLSLCSSLLSQNLSQTVEIYLSDISSQALIIAQANLELIKSTITLTPEISEPIFIQANLLSNWSVDKKLDLIVANLPYIPTKNLENLPASVRNYEPILALDGGPDGLVLINELLFQAKSVIFAETKILLEVDESHSLDQILKLRPEYNYQAVADCFGKFRFVIAALKQ